MKKLGLYSCTCQSGISMHFAPCEYQCVRQCAALEGAAVGFGELGRDGRADGQAESSGKPGSQDRRFRHGSLNRWVGYVQR